MAEIVVAGCGIAGLEAALRTERGTGKQVTVVNPADSTVFYPSLHNVLEGKDFGDVRIDLEEAFSGRDIELVEGRVAGMDPDQNVLELDDGELGFEKAVIAVGSETSYGSIEGQGNVHDLRFRDDTADVVERVEENSVDHVVIIGGGATGVEAAAALYHASEQLEHFSLTVLEGEERLLPKFGAAMGDVVEEDYRSRGIDVRTDTFVSRIEEDRVVIEGGEELASDLTVWAGGVENNPVLDRFGLDYSERGLKVDEHMRCGEDIYAAGDVVDYPGKVNRAFYGIAEAKTAATNIARELAGKGLKEHHVRWDPNLVYLGQWDSLFELKGFTWRGRIPALMRSLGVEKRYLWTRRHLL